MTSKKIGMTLVALVILAAFVAGASAATNPERINVTSGDTVYIGEQGLNLTDITVATTLQHFYAGSVDKQIAVTEEAARNFYVDPGFFKGYSGNWTNGAISYNVQEPTLEVALYVVDNSTGKFEETLVSDKKVVEGQIVGIKVSTDLFALFKRDGTNTSGNGIDVKIQNPVGTVLDGVINASGAVDNIPAEYVMRTPLTNFQPVQQQEYIKGYKVAGANSTWDKDEINSTAAIWNMNTKNYVAGTYTVWAECNANGMKDNFDVTGATISKAVTIALDKETITITADKETVVRNNAFAVTIEANPKTQYLVWFSGSSGYSYNEVPAFTPNQRDVAYVSQMWLKETTYKNTGKLATDLVSTEKANSSWLYAPNEHAVVVKTDASGKIVVGISTNQNTKDTTYTIRAQKFNQFNNATVFNTSNETAMKTLPALVNATGDVYGIADVNATYTGAKADGQLYDTVKVKVEKGAVTITAAGDGAYYLGEEIKLSGTNTDSDDTYLFITGANLKTSGAVLTNPASGINYSVGSDDNTRVVVKTDDTWEYKWDTAKVGIDAGTYTIYAVSTTRTKDDLSGAKYDTVSVVIKKPFVTATTSAATVAKGDKLYIRGTAEGNPTPGVAVWILGKNYWNGKNDIVSQSNMVTETVNDDGSFEHEVTAGVTKNLASGQYFVVVQHPMYNDQFDVFSETLGEESVIVRENFRSSATPADKSNNNQFYIWGAGKLQGSDAAEALITLINSASIDDTYTKLTFLVEEPWIRINSVGDHYIGDNFQITGTTNLAVDDDLIVEVTSSSFQPTQKTQSGEFSGVSGTVKIAAGSSYNEWAMDVDASTFKADEYIVNVEAIEAECTATTTFNILSGTATVAPTTAPTTAPTAAPTTAPTTAPTPAATASPGFGALVALIGLGAVAALVMRKD